MKLYEKIQFLRKKNGMSQEDLAFQLDVSRQAVYKWETGTSNPEVDKIKRLSEIFGVSFNELLNDEIGLGAHVEANRGPVYRNVFHSQKTLSGSAADFYHGYDFDVHRRKSYQGKVRKYKEFFDMFQREFCTETEKRNYTKLIRLQPDMAAGFFTDDNRGVIGFFWDNAEQFVCPYENILDVSVTNSGPSTNYDYIPSVGFSLGKVSGVSVGVQPLANVGGPSSYDLLISYFTKKGDTSTYRLHLNNLRMYELCNRGDIADRTLRRFLSMRTQRTLEEIHHEIIAARAKGERIKNGLLKKEDVDLAHCAKIFEAGEEKRKQHLIEIRENIKWEKKRKLLRTLLFTLGPVALVALIIFLYSI